MDERASAQIFIGDNDDTCVYHLFLKSSILAICVRLLPFCYCCCCGGVGGGGSSDDLLLNFNKQDPKYHQP